MKTLVLIRHAKSSWKDKNLKDMERPLKKRGTKDAGVMGKVLKDMQLVPELILTSPAVRARETARLLAREYNIDINQLVLEPMLYLESKAKLLKVINTIDDKFNTVFLISHNPGLTDLANTLSGESIENIPTSGVFALQFDVSSWAEADKGNARKTIFEVPKNHRKKVEKNEKPVLQP